MAYIRIIREQYEEESKGNTLKVLKCDDGGYILSLVKEEEGYYECDSLFVPGDINVEGDINIFTEDIKDNEKQR